MAHRKNPLVGKRNNNRHICRIANHPSCINTFTFDEFQEHLALVHTCLDCGAVYNYELIDVPNQGRFCAEHAHTKRCTPKCCK